MARYDMSSTECGALGAVASGTVYFQLGLSYAIGRSVPLDRVTAHKWLNLAAREGVARVRSPGQRLQQIAFVHGAPAPVGADYRPGAAAAPQPATFRGTAASKL